ncbi:MAG: hypothetical protein DI537_05070 [Stutzerimonas stutzeri]|nr:MAG: hypothetical protein DI537_05070 [Stutzerimonas stutzeri]
MNWIILSIVIPALAYGISKLMPSNPNAAVITAAAIFLLCLKLLETRWAKIRRGPGIATVVMWVAYLLVTAGATLVTIRDSSLPNIGVLAVMLCSGLFLRFWPNWPRVITRVVNAERHEQLARVLKEFEDEEHPALQEYPLKRLARFAVVEAGGQRRAVLKLLGDPSPLEWSRSGPVMNCWVVSGDGKSAWPVDLEFRNSKATLSLAPFHAGGPTVAIDLEEGEVFIRHLKSKPRNAARRADLDQNPFLTLASQMLAGAEAKSASELIALRRELAKRLHPDQHRGADQKQRADALAVANSRVDQLLVYAA